MVPEPVSDKTPEATVKDPPPTVPVTLTFPPLVVLPDKLPATVPPFS